MNNLLPEVSIKNWLIDVLPYEVMWMNENGQIIYANKLCYNNLGYKKNEIEKLTIYDINTSTTVESWKIHWELVKKEKIHHFISTHTNKDGKIYEIEINAQFFSNNGNNFICSIQNDITNSSFYRNLMETTAQFTLVGGWNLNLYDGSILLTEETLNIFKTKDKEDLLPKNVIHFFNDTEKVKKLLSGVIKNSSTIDTILETKENPKRYIRSVAKAVLKNDKAYKIVGAYQDVTEQQKRENTLQFHKQIIDNAEDMIYVYDINGKLIHYSYSLIKQLGYTKKQLDAANIYDLDPSVTKDWWKNHMKEIINKGSLHFEWLAVRKDGTKFPVDITANHVIYEGVNLNCAIVRNITERKMRDLKLYEALEEIKSLKVKLENENEYLQEELNKKINFDNIICESKNYKKILENIDKVAPTDTTVLITGESGTGKELLANAIHTNSLRKKRPLIKVNCATLPKDLIESELFGHKKGAFTGANENKVGKFTLADGGTIFLDEIGEIPIELQAKLLRVLQEGEFDELGGTKMIKVNVRIIAATNRDLLDMIKEGRFREDLYYRLNVFPVYNIPLRERKEDIPILAQYFLEKYAAKAGKAFKRLAKKTIDSLLNYNFPGNIRELENLIQRAVIIESGTTLNPGNWIPESNSNNSSKDLITLDAMQHDYIVKILEHTDWRVSGPNGAATILNVKDKTLFAKMKRLGIEKQITLKNK